MLEGCTFDVALAEHAAGFFPRYLSHSKGSRWAGKPFDLLPWERDDLVMPLFGWLRANGTRRFRRAYIEIPKKNGKSILGSGIGLYMFCADGEPGAQVYSAATDIKQANIVHQEAVNMVDASPQLSAELKVNRSTYNISHLASRSFYRALSGIPRGKHGFNAHAIIIDELHEWQGRKLWDALKYAMRGRDQGLIFIITTAGDDPLSVCHEQHEHAQGVISGAIEDLRYFGLIYAADPKDDYTNEKVWHKTNPSLGVAIDLEEFRADFRDAQRTPTELAVWKQLSLNLWNTGGERWLAPDLWAACQRDFTPEDLAGRDCWAGLDLAQTLDTTALVLVFPMEDGSFKVLPFFWLPEETAKKMQDRVPWLQWAEAGHVRLTPGNVCDYGFVKSQIRELALLFNIRELAFDPKFAEQVTQEIEQGSCDSHGQVIEEGTGIPRIKFPQTITNFCGPTAELERLVLSQQIHHNGHPVLAWQVGNTNVYTDCNCNKRPTKPTPNDYRKIDGVVGTIMALGRATTGDGATGAGIQIL